jgi:MHS family shikimate/dehydroshikimate transporter-like MFS transporter
MDVTPAAKDTDPSRGRAARAATIGSVLEYYDFTLFAAAAATVFPKVFFPDASPLLASLQSIGIFSIAYIVRPLAGWILASLGDRKGRSRILLRTLMIMGVATFLVGLLPGYTAIGAAAPVLLILLRLAQGIGAAGEYNGAVLVAVEFAPKKRRGLYGSFPALGPAAGGTLASLVMLTVSSALSGPAFLDWGWRIPFLAGGVLAIYAYWLRRTLQETPDFRRAEAAGTTSRTPLRDVIRSHPRILVAMLLIFLTLGGHTNMYLVFGPSFAGRTAGFSPTILFIAIVVGYGSQVLVTPFFGWLSDQIDRRIVVGSGFVLLVLFAYPFFWLIQPGWPLGMMIGVVLTQGIAISAIFAPISTLMAERLPPQVRFSGLALSRETGNAIGSAVFPVLAVVLTSTGATDGLSLLLVVLAVVGLLAVTVIPRAQPEPDAALSEKTVAGTREPEPTG